MVSRYGIEIFAYHGNDINVVFVVHFYQNLGNVLKDKISTLLEKNAQSKNNIDNSIISLCKKYFLVIDFIYINFLLLCNILPKGYHDEKYGGFVGK